MIAVYLVAISVALINYYTVQNRADYRFVVETIEQREQPGDAITWGDRWHEPLLYYYDGCANIYWRSMVEVTTPEAIQQWISQFPTGYERQWVMMSDAKSLTKDFERALENAYSVEETFDYGHHSKVMLLKPLKQPSAQAPIK